MDQKKTKVRCSIRCSHCKDFGHFRNYTKAEGHYRGVFLCEDCRANGVKFPGEEPRVKEIEEPVIKEEENTGITSLLLGNQQVKKAKKPI